eukprot:g43082.t1
MRFVEVCESCSNCKKNPGKYQYEYLPVLQISAKLPKRGFVTCTCTTLYVLTNQKIGVHAPRPGGFLGLFFSHELPFTHDPGKIGLKDIFNQHFQKISGAEVICGFWVAEVLATRKTEIFRLTSFNTNHQQHNKRQGPRLARGEPSQLSHSDDPSSTSSIYSAAVDSSGTKRKRNKRKTGRRASLQAEPGPLDSPSLVGGPSRQQKIITLTGVDDPSSRTSSNTSLSGNTRVGDEEEDVLESEFIMRTIARSALSPLAPSDLDQKHSYDDDVISAISSHAPQPIPSSITSLSSSHSLTIPLVAKPTSVGKSPTEFLATPLSASPEQLLSTPSPCPSAQSTSLSPNTTVSSPVLPSPAAFNTSSSLPSPTASPTSSFPSPSSSSFPPTSAYFPSPSSSSSASAVTSPPRHAPSPSSSRSPSRDPSSSSSHHTHAPFPITRQNSSSSERRRSIPRRSSSTPASPALSRQNSLSKVAPPSTSSPRTLTAAWLHDAKNPTGSHSPRSASPRSSTSRRFSLSRNSSAASTPSPPLGSGPALSRQRSMENSNSNSNANRGSISGSSRNPDKRRESAENADANSDTLPDHTPSGVAVMTPAAGLQLTFDEVQDPKAIAQARQALEAQLALQAENLDSKAMALRQDNLLAPVALARIHSDPTDYCENVPEEAPRGLFDSPNDDVADYLAAGNVSSPISPPIDAVSPQSHELEPDSNDDMSSDDEDAVCETDLPLHPPNFGAPALVYEYPEEDLPSADDDDLPFGRPQLVRQNGFYNQATSSSANGLDNSDDDLF